MGGATVVAKFVVTQVTHYETAGCAQVTLEPRYAKGVAEDQRFAEATPCGKLEMTVTNPRALEHLKPGAIFYLNLVPAPEGTSRYHE